MGKINRKVLEKQPLDKSSCLVRNQLSTKDWAFKSPDSSRSFQMEDRWRSETDGNSLTTNGTNFTNGERLRRGISLAVSFPWLLGLNLSEAFLPRVGSRRQPLQRECKSHRLLASRICGWLFASWRTFSKIFWKGQVFWKDFFCLRRSWVGWAAAGRQAGRR